MGWNAVPALVIITGVWVVGKWALDHTQVWREEKPMWAYNKDFYQRALLRRDWYLHREAETLSRSTYKCYVAVLVLPDCLAH